MLADFRNSFTSGLSSKHATKYVIIKISSNLNCVYLVKFKCQKTNDSMKEMA